MNDGIGMSSVLADKGFKMKSWHRPEINISSDITSWFVAFYCAAWLHFPPWTFLAWWSRGFLCRIHLTQQPNRVAASSHFNLNNKRELGAQVVSTQRYTSNLTNLGSPYGSNGIDPQSVRSSGSVRQLSEVEPVEEPPGPAGWNSLQRTCCVRTDGKHLGWQDVPLCFLLGL